MKLIGTCLNRKNRKMFDSCRLLNASPINRFESSLRLFFEPEKSQIPACIKTKIQTFQPQGALFSIDPRP